MTICPVALAVTCKKCAVVNFCLLKTVIGDFKPEDPAQTKPPAGTGDEKRKG
jgi:hypothetical protein